MMRFSRLFRKDIAREVAGWIRDDVIDKPQGEAILARYGLTLDDADSSSLGYYVLTSLATLFVGLALILIVSHNWDELPRMARMLGLVGLTLTVNLVGIRYLLRDRYRAGVLWLFFGALCYGASIMLIAQIYHLGEHFPDGIFYWALGILPLLLLTQSRLFALLLLVLSTLWLFVEGETGFFPTLYPVFTLPVLWLMLTRRESALLFLLAMAGLVLWLNMALGWHLSGKLTFDVVIDQVPLNIALGLLLSGAALWWMRHSDHRLRDYGQALYLWLLRFGLLLLLILSFSDMWEAFPGDIRLPGYAVPLALLLGGGIGMVLARPSGLRAAGPLWLSTVFFVPIFVLIYADLWFDPQGFSLSMNLLLLLCGIWLIRSGIEDGATQLFYTGVVALLLTAFMRYIDLIGDYIGGAVLFMVAALVLFAAARYWQKVMARQGGGHA